jgi:hypothetical protein
LHIILSPEQLQQQQGEPGSSGRSSDRRRRWQEREQEQASGELAAAAAESTADSHPGMAEEGQRSEVQVGGCVVLMVVCLC